MEIICKIDRIITNFDLKDEKEMSLGRTQLRDLLQEYACVETNKDLTLPQTIAYIQESASTKKRDVSMVLIHALNSDYIFRAAETDGKIVSILDNNLPDIYKKFDIEIKQQTFEKIDKIRSIHSEFMSSMIDLSSADESIGSILFTRQKIKKIINDKSIGSYLNHLDFERIKNHINKHIEYIELFNSNSELFYGKIPDVINDIESELTYCEENINYLSEIYLIYLKNLKISIEAERDSSKDNFNCSIKQFAGSGTHAQKKYPFHLVGNKIKISLPLVVEGPGNAKNVCANVSVGNSCISLTNKLISLGTVTPGEFIVLLELTVNEVVSIVSLEVVVEWGVTGDSTVQSDIFEFVFSGQNPNVDWESLKGLDPYSLEIAHGDSFIGRKDTIRKIWNRLSSPTVSSSYITGQKRVGKSSLAHAVIEKGTSSSSNYVFIYKEYGDYGNESARETLNELGQQLVDEIVDSLTVSESGVYTPESFNGSLSPLIKLVSSLQKKQPEKKIVIVLDEFDEMHHELYRIGSLAETFFNNLRALSGRKNLGFILVGSESMPHVISAQGDKLNKFSKESLDSFDRVSEWEDYEDLIKSPVEKYIQWHDDAISAIYEESSGHPFFTKSICSPLINEAIRLRDSEITGLEVRQFLPVILSQLDVNIFAHFWKDGIEGGYEEKEIISLDRRRVLIAYARTIRNGDETSLSNISKNVSGKSLNEDQVQFFLNSFCVRNVMEESESKYSLCVKLFERWLTTGGISIIIPDQLGDELSDSRSILEDKAYVNSNEIVDLVDKWPLYNDNKITTEHVRSWLEQDPSKVNQRLLFTLLDNLEFPCELSTNDMLFNAHDSLKTVFAKNDGHITRKKSDRRKDIVVTYIDGAGKSGAYYSQKYTRMSLVSTTSNIEFSMVSKRLAQASKDKKSLSGIIVVDDFIGTGGSISENIETFIEDNMGDLIDLDIPIRLVVLYATVEGEQAVRNQLRSLNYGNIDLHVCKSLDDSNFPFSENSHIWKDTAEQSKAKELCRHHGLNLSKNAPLGYKNQGLLLVFPRNCPNNSLAILHTGKSKGGNSWWPLFKRIPSI